MEAAKKPRGRPPKDPANRLERITLFVPPDVRKKIEQYGQEWARAALKRARPPAG